MNNVFDEEADFDGVIRVRTTTYSEGGRELVETNWAVRLVQDCGDYLMCEARVESSDRPDLDENTVIDLDIEYDATVFDIEDEIRAALADFGY